jgi:dienelactone hydrolase
MLMLGMSIGMFCFTVAQSDPFAQPPDKVTFAAVDLVPDKWTSFQFPTPLPGEIKANNLVQAHVLMANRERSAVVVLLHYWGASDLNNERQLAQRLARNGISSVILEMPYHLSRAPLGTRSGELAVTPDPVRLRSTMIQATQEVQRAIDWIETRPEFDPMHIGLCGTSLGGIVGSLVFAVEPRISAYASVLGGAQISRIVWRSSRLARERETLRSAGWDEKGLVAEFVDVEPTTYLKADDPRPSYVIGARYDTVIPRDCTQALIKGLGDPEVLWLRTGHYGGALVQSSIHTSVTNFFSKTFGGSGFTAPGRLYAPTLRLGTPTSTEQGLQIGIGLDFWQSGSTFGTIFLTPRGPQGFIGAHLSGGFALGISVAPRRTSPGLLWSVVL